MGEIIDFYEFEEGGVGGEGCGKCLRKYEVMFLEGEFLYFVCLF